MADEKIAEVKPVRRTIHPSRFKLAEQVVNTHCIVVENGVSFEAMKDPAYWAHVARQLRPGDEIKVRTDDGAYAALLYVKDVSHQAARVVPVWHIDLSKAETLPTNEEYQVAYAGPHHKWRIVRKSDKAIIQHGFESEQAANVAMASHIQAMAA